MKRLWTVLCAAAFGFVAVAQAQVVKNESLIRTEPKAIKENAAGMIGLPDMSGVSVGRLQDAGERWYDTLLWHDMYTNADCAADINSTYYSENGALGKAVVPGVFSPYMNGTGEVGVTYQTEDNLYYLYAAIDVRYAWVVGAVVTACRMGSTAGWAGLQDKLGRFNPYQMNVVDGLKIPNMPFKLIGYGPDKVQMQEAFKSYTEMILDNAAAEYIDIEMPVSTAGRAETETFYLPYQPIEYEDGRQAPTYYTIGGLFDKKFDASQNFGISFCVNLTGDKTYDSLWNSNMGAKSNAACTFVEEWSVWQRFDFRNHDKAWVGFWSNDGYDIDVQKPWFTEEDGETSGFAPTPCPQTEANSLFVYGHCLLRLSSGTHYKPTLYPIIQHGAAANESNKDAYAQTVSVYPLPATDKVNIVALDEIQKVEIFNMAGALVKAIKMNDIHLELDVTSFLPGTYVAKITTEKGVASKKLLVK